MAETMADMCSGNRQRDVDAQILSFFEGFVDEEWDRMEKTPADRVSLALHHRLLSRHIAAGDRVLEIGAGAGRFSVALAAAGARVTVTDVSPAQLDAAHRRLDAAGLSPQVDAVEVADIRDLTRLAIGSFDAVVAFGGPLSYTFEEAPAALEQVASMLRPGGVFLASVMSTAGTSRSNIADILGLVSIVGVDEVDYVIGTGDLRRLQRTGHVCRMFYADELAALIDGSPLVALEYSASSWMATADCAELDDLVGDPERWAAFVEWEAAMSARPGCVDGGTHILLAARHPE
jgi:2-polyprenyl-3-methyl-5-hydroxy-6-metoxy-1,4-benzoquinol methylase